MVNCWEFKDRREESRTIGRLLVKFQFIRKEQSETDMLSTCRKYLHRFRVLVRAFLFSFALSAFEFPSPSLSRLFYVPPRCSINRQSFFGHPCMQPSSSWELYIIPSIVHRERQMWISRELSSSSDQHKHAVVPHIFSIRYTCHQQPAQHRRNSHKAAILEERRRIYVCTQWAVSKIYDIFTRSAAVKEIYNRVSIYLWRVKSVFSFRWNIIRVWRALESGEGKKVFLAYFSIENCNFSSRIFFMRNIRVKWARYYLSISLMNKRRFRRKNVLRNRLTSECCHAADM